MAQGPYQLVDVDGATYGGDVARWPAELRDDAVTLLANSGQARERIAAALRMERGVRGEDGEAAPPGLTDRIMRAAFQKRPPRRGT